MDKRTVLISQLLMTFMMAVSMSGIMSLLSLGPTAAWLDIWPKQFLIAWPVAFVLTLVAWPLSMALTRRLVRPASDERNNG
ncbi:DUF2798 domain-containing protein [Pseudaminobacter soli (ex Zhang et al. 2022)]|nr:DUF2798 domain-containing protein [Pseudaminobacter soli]